MFVRNDIIVKKEIKMEYNEAVKKINSFLAFGVKPGLERIRELVDRLGSPDKGMKFVHVAGTNGKGSTCAMISETLTNAGYKTGRFISPYVLEFRERFMIDGKMIPKQTLADLTEEILPYTEDMRKEGKIITEFEFIFALSLLWYKREGCDIVVLETGLGGRFDATNIIDTPLCSVITSISLDHTAILGDTYEKIAFEKCGIIKPDSICVAYGKQDENAMKVIAETAVKRNNRLIIADGDNAEIINADISGTVFRYKETEIMIRLPGQHMVRNAVTALETIFALRDRKIDISHEIIKESFCRVTFPARMEVLSKKPLIIVDGAHNPDGAKALSEALKMYIPEKRKTGVVGMLADKDVKTSLSCLVPLFDKIYTVEPDNPRKMTSEELAKTISPYCNDITPCVDLRTAYKNARSQIGENDALIIFGSLYLASDMRRIAMEEEKNADL